MSETTLYKLDSKGKLQEWTITVQDSSYYTVSGKVGGKMVTSAPTVCKGVNHGKSNELSPEQHAMSTAESLVTKKLDAGYSYDIPAGDLSPKFNTTLAHVFTDHAGKIKGPICISPKLDGMRCYINEYGMFTRNHKPIVSCPHIWDQYRTVCDTMGSYPVLDGELYNHDLRNDFNTIISLCKKQKPSAEDLEMSRRTIQHHIFDMVDYEHGFLWRSAFLKRTLFPTYTNIVSPSTPADQLPVNGYFRMVPQFVAGVVGGDILTYTDGTAEPFQEAMARIVGHYENLGYEGAMLRWGDNTYETKRTDKLLKLKTFTTNEFRILDVIEGKGGRAGMAGALVLELTDDKNFQSNILRDAIVTRRLTTTLRAEDAGLYEDLLKNKESYIGLYATCKYQNMTPAGVPRFPVTVAIRDYE